MSTPQNTRSRACPEVASLEAVAGGAIAAVVILVFSLDTRPAVEDGSASRSEVALRDALFVGLPYAGVSRRSA
ncbi:hypothetical protein WBO78_21990 [Bosea sp. CCNWLW174]|uniref:hypothetical protein n=1 Tax=unclassified Bosea (in: a-proteobacteria) TaxID=2653178 RepID=UPI0030144AA5